MRELDRNRDLKLEIKKIISLLIINDPLFIINDPLSIGKHLASSLVSYQV